jgi:hypothetical protein
MTLFTVLLHAQAPLLTDSTWPATIATMPTIQHEERYVKYIELRGVGTNDQVACSRASYVSYLNSVSALLKEDISPARLHSEEDIANIVSRLKGARAEKTIRNYAAAMRQYVSMVREDGLSADLSSAELTDIERREKVALNDNSIPVLAAIRANGLLTDDDWNRIKGYLGDALKLLSGSDESAQEVEDETSIISLDADPRSADWPKVASARRLAGQELPSWAALWLWWLRMDSSQQFWQDVGSIARQLDRIARENAN